MKRDDSKILDSLNVRNEEVFGSLFLLFYDEFSYFAKKLFYSTDIHYEDALQEVFVKIWENKHVVFSSIDHFKNFVYLSLKNQYRDYLRHQKHIHSHIKSVALNDEAIFTYLVESETLSQLSSIKGLLPHKCSLVLKMYIEGWSVKEIAVRFGLKESTVYNQKNRAITILKEKLKKFNLL